MSNTEKVKKVHPLFYPFAKIYYHLIEIPKFKILQWWHENNYYESVIQPPEVTGIQAGAELQAIPDRQIIQSANFDNPMPVPMLPAEIHNKSMGLVFSAGIGLDRQPVLIDLACAPHLLGAGGSGSGKSIFAHSMLCQLIAGYSKDLMELILCDLKGGVEFQFYKNAPNVERPIARNVDDASNLINYLIQEMERRNALFEERGCRDVIRFNSKFPSEYMRRIVFVIDEYYDIVANGEELGLEGKIEELMRKSRSCGMHVILLTQRPDRETVHPRIRANANAVVCLKTSTAVNSRVILGVSGAEKLRGKGHMLIRSPSGEIKEAQGHNVTDDELDQMAAIFAKAKKLQYNDAFNKEK